MDGYHSGAHEGRRIYYRQNGVGRNVLAFQPAMMIPEEDIEAMLSALDKVLAGLSQFVNE